MDDRDVRPAEGDEHLERARREVWDAFTHGRLDEDAATARLLRLAYEQRAGRSQAPQGEAPRAARSDA